jgi:hypothetical protein
MMRTIHEATRTDTKRRSTHEIDIKKTVWNRVRIGQVGLAELLTEDTLARRMHGGMSYGFRMRLDVNKEANGNP